MSDVRTARVTVGENGDVDVPESVAEVVEEHRDTIEIVAEGDDEPAEWARAWLREAENAEISHLGDLQTKIGCLWLKTDT